MELLSFFVAVRSKKMYSPENDQKRCPRYLGIYVKSMKIKNKN